MSEIRVKVHSGNGQEYLGEGWYVGDVTVYFIRHPDGHLTSNENAEVPPSAESLPEGSEIVRSENNPKIRMMDGTIMYGCQVWWEPVESAKSVDLGGRWR